MRDDAEETGGTLERLCEVVATGLDDKNLKTTLTPISCDQPKTEIPHPHPKNHVIIKSSASTCLQSSGSGTLGTKIAPRTLKEEFSF